MSNELLVGRVAFANFVPTTATTYTSDAIIPKGALLKSVTTVEGTALASGTSITFKVGSQAITAAILLEAFTGNDAHALTTADGLVTTVGGALSITSVGVHSAGDIDVYVEYYYAPDHT